MTNLFWIQKQSVIVVLVALLGGLSGCNRNQKANSQGDDEADSAVELVTDLIFDNITLEQSDDQGALRWRMIADQAIYSQDRRDATIEKPSGQFFDKEQPAFSVTAERGEVKQDGNRLLLIGNVTIVDEETGATIKGDKMRWIPNNNTIVLTDNIRAEHPDFRMTAQEMTVWIDEDKVQVSGDVKAETTGAIGDEATGNQVGNQATGNPTDNASTEDGDIGSETAIDEVTEDEVAGNEVTESKTSDTGVTDSVLQLNGEEIIWFLDEERVISDRPIRFQQLKDDVVTARAQGNQVEFDIQAQIANLNDEAVVVLQDPPMRVTGDALQFNQSTNTVSASKRFTVFHQAENITMVANEGQGNLGKNVFQMNGNVIVTAQRNQARLRSDQLTWTLATQKVVAEGNVVYRQIDPVFKLKGPTAVGKLEDETIVVSGGRVVTEIIPDS